MHSYYVAIQRGYSWKCLIYTTKQNADEFINVTYNKTSTFQFRMLVFIKPNTFIFDFCSNIKIRKTDLLINVQNYKFSIDCKMSPLHNQPESIN